MDCGELIALSVTRMFAVSVPVFVGVKWPWMVQVAPGAMPDPQLLTNTKEVAFVPLTATPVIASGLAPVLVTVTVCEGLVVPTAWLAKVKLGGEKETVVELSATPVPLRAIVCGDPTAVSLMVTVAVSAPAAIGAKWP